MKSTTETELPGIADAELELATGGNWLESIKSWFSSSNPQPTGQGPTCPYTDGRRYSRTLCPNGPGK